MDLKHSLLFVFSIASIACDNASTRASTAAGGSVSNTGGVDASGGTDSESDPDLQGGTTNTSSRAAGGKGGSTRASGGATSTGVGGSSASAGGKSGTSSTPVGGSSVGGNRTSAGGASSGGDTASTGGASATSAAGYALPPPSECSNQFSVQGCIKGDASSTCKGVCSNDYGATSKSACEGDKEGVPVQFGCPRFLLFSTPMMQAAIDDGYEGKFNYAVVGHDPDTTNLDKGLNDSCCQCYQLIFDAPRYLTNSTLTPPNPLIVQSFNTQASGPTGFDVFMGAGGLGAYNGCSDSIPSPQAKNSLYTAYPSVGQAFSGGVKPGPDSLKCSDANNNLSDTLIAAESCQTKVRAACNEITAKTESVQEETRTSCIQSNQATSYYHENWKVYAKRVACPTHLTEVTGCKLAPQSGVGAPDPSVQTVAQAVAKGGFSNTLNNEPYHTTTMQDCCMPTCAWKNHVGSETVDGYNSFYSCLEDGTPVTQPSR